MKFSLASIAALALTATAAPTTKAARDVLAQGSGQNGSIYSFLDAVTERNVLAVNGACGLSTYFPDALAQGLPLVAMPSGAFDPYGSSQYNTLCGKVITLTNGGVTKQAMVADRNYSVDNSIDMTIDVWEAFGGSATDGSVIPGFTWSVAA